MKPVEIGEKVEGGGFKVGSIIVAADAKEEQNAATVGTIVSIGEDSFVAYRPKTEFWGLKAGDVIHYPRYAGKWCTDSKTKEELLVINDEDVLLVEVQDDVVAKQA